MQPAQPRLIILVLTQEPREVVSSSFPGFLGQHLLSYPWQLCHRDRKKRTQRNRGGRGEYREDQLFAFVYKFKTETGKCCIYFHLALWYTVCVYMPRLVWPSQQGWEVDLFIILDLRLKTGSRRFKWSFRVPELANGKVCLCTHISCLHICGSFQPMVVVIENSQKAWHTCVSAKLLHLCPTVCDPMDPILPGSSVCGILQARILEWIAMPSSRGSFQPMDWPCIFCDSYIAGVFFTPEPLGKPKSTILKLKKKII